MSTTTPYKPSFAMDNIMPRGSNDDIMPRSMKNDNSPDDIMPRGIDMKPVIYKPDDTGTGDMDAKNFTVNKPLDAKDYDPTDMEPGCQPPINIFTKTNTPLQIKYKVIGSGLDWQVLPSLRNKVSSFFNPKEASTASDIWTVNRKIKERMLPKQIETGKFEVDIIHLRTAESLCKNLSTQANSNDYFFGVSIYPGEEIESLNNDGGDADTATGGKRKTRKHRKAKKSRKHRKHGKSKKGRSRRRRTHKKK